MMVFNSFTATNDCNFGMQRTKGPSCFPVDNLFSYCGEISSEGVMKPVS